MQATGDDCSFRTNDAFKQKLKKLRNRSPKATTLETSLCWKHLVTNEKSKTDRSAGLSLVKRKPKRGLIRIPQRRQDSHLLWLQK